MFLKSQNIFFMEKIFLLEIVKLIPMYQQLNNYYISISGYAYEF